MRYSGNLCDGCHQPLNDDDDIVVCPLCATPQHRDCYEKNNCCVNSHLHGTDFTWQGSTNLNPVFPDEPQEKQSADELTCPRCGMKSPPGTERCPGCGMKFTIFGVNVVEEIQKEEAQTQQSQQENKPTIPDYQPPFKPEEDECFYAESDETPTDSAESNGSAETPSQDSFKGPFPPEDRTFGVKTNTLAAFIRGNAVNYINKFKWMDIRGSRTFNWAAFFFAPYWFFYRKLIKPGIIFMTVNICASIIMTPYMNRFLELYQTLLSSDFENMGTQALTELMSQLGELMIPLYIFIGIMFIMNLLAGFFANTLYKNHILKYIAMSENFQTPAEKYAVFAKKGGTSFLFVLIAYFAYMLLSYAASALLY